jgi:acetyltransferase-like isoleucine patch superfamily enzyme
VVDRAIVDKNVSIGPNAVVGFGSDFETANRQEPTRLNTGITVVGKRAVIPAGVRLGRNVKVNEGARPADYGGKRVFASGSTIEVRRTPAGAAARGRATSARLRAEGEPLAGRMTAAQRGDAR